MKARIFIGSSSEGFEVANYIKEQLADFDCITWKDDIFKYNVSFFDTLLNEASYFDFGILVATKDDFTKVRSDYFDTPRDNVIFEFGLFLGRLGASRAFVIQEKDSRLPSDMLGITVPNFERTADLSKSDSLNKEIERIRKTVNEKIKLGELGLLPSTALAIGYFHGFISLVSDAVLFKPELEIDGVKFTSFELNIVMPSELDGDIRKRITLFNRKHSLKEIILETNGGRKFPIFVNYDTTAAPGFLKMYDMPTTLTGIDKAIQLYMRKGHIGKSPEQILLERRELDNFQRTLQHLIDNDSFAKNIVQIVVEM